MVYISNSSKKHGENTISIEKWSPGINYSFYSDLCPDDSIVSEYRATNDKDKFVRSYRQQLNSLYPAQVAGDLNGKTIICKNEFCGDVCICDIIKSWFLANDIKCEEAIA